MDASGVAGFDQREIGDCPYFQIGDCPYFRSVWRWLGVLPLALASGLV